MSKVYILVEKEKKNKKLNSILNSYSSETEAYKEMDLYNSNYYSQENQYFATVEIHSLKS